jgi:hypothetical protein
MDGQQLRLNVTERMAAGKLPVADCLVTWYGSGFGQECAVCDARILSTDLGVECDLSGSRTMYFHSPCYDLWHAALP